MDEVKIVEKQYNEVPYMSKSFYYTLPEKQKTVLQLLGFETPELKNARILEIGCSFGGNIIPFAIAHPNAEIIGIDLAEVQVNEGNNIIKFLGLDNIKLIHKNIMDFDESYGKFDYIICHGVFSWVIEEVQNKILEIIKTQLSDNGSAVISYNTYPGWKNVDILRDIMQFRIESLNKNGNQIESYEKVRYGKGAIEFLEKFSFLSEYTKAMVADIKEKDAYYILHEYFEASNTPLYLYDFNKKLLKYDLFHVVDSDISRSFPIFSDPQVEISVENECAGDHIVREQYYDYLLNRQFRVSIVTHLKNKEKINLTKMVKIDSLNKLNIRGYFQKNEEGKYIREGNVLVDELNEIIENLNVAFPNTISIESLAKKLNTDENFYQRIMQLIYSKTIEFFSEKIEIYKPKKLKLSEKYRKYVEYALSAENPMISFSNFSGLVTNVSKTELSIMTLFNGERSDKEIENLIKTNIENGNLSITRTEENSDTRTDEEIIRDFIKNVREFLEINMMYEK
ncbi:MAG: methyltransferase regulatory domain-containing protein [Fusobacterium sp.]|uniref:methyltransferase regulatory domain-containing protein n=1 Tax=Fusobacterium sp. TaxID=68766 RepID=UPI0026DD6CFC|nr:methyltransferase regulatory domain-containing protein [Fusobacterium sp.]MDO4690607.1 methyltransferase regulatory domain-containing protein [Fusobacterium sp.]